jgi:hypothetical protein
MDADPACFAGVDIEIRAWLDGPPDTGFEAPFVEPGWLDLPAPNLPALWTSPPVEPDHLCAPDALPCNWFFLHIDPASGVTLDFPPRWLLVTGHIDDPAAATCHFVYPADWADERLGDEIAVAGCRERFVLDSYRDAP